MGWALALLLGLVVDATTLNALDSKMPLFIGNSGYVYYWKCVVIP